MMTGMIGTAGVATAAFFGGASDFGVGCDVDGSGAGVVVTGSFKVGSLGVSFGASFVEDDGDDAAGGADT